MPFNQFARKKSVSAFDITDKEFRFLLACARVQPRPEDFAVQAELAPQLDSARLLALVDRHRIGPLVSHHIKAHAPGTFAPELTQELAAPYRDNVFKTLTVTAQWRRLDSMLRAAGISYLVLKGLPLAAQYYGEASHRHNGDLDLLIRAEDFAQVLQLLTAHGYRADENFAALTPRQLKHNLLVMHHCELQAPNSGLTLELHWRPSLNPHELAGLDWQPGSVHVQQTNVSGGELPQFAPEALLIYLCAHGAKHVWFRLKWAFDLPQLLECRDWDWPRVFALARAEDCERSLLLGLSVAHELFGWPLPPLVAQILAQRRAELAPLSAFVIEALHSPESWWGRGESKPLALIIKNWRYQWRLHRGVGDWRYALAALATGDQDWALLPLPDKWFFLYFPLRPFLFARRWLQRRFE